MTKYHIRTDGSIGVCRAKEGKCPYTTHIMADTVEQAQIEADVLAYQNIKIERKQNGGMYLDDMLDSDTADIIREQLKQKNRRAGLRCRLLSKQYYACKRVGSQTGL